MLAPAINILPLTTIRKERLLPVPGRVVIRQGQKVAPNDVIAEANLNPEHLVLNVARGLGVSIEQASRLIQRSVGDEINEGDLIAGPVGLARRVVRAPASGEVVLVGGGKLLLRVDTPPYELRAGIGGIITQLIPELGAIIETTGALAQGVWGNGKADFGLLQVKMSTADDKLVPDQLDVSLRGTVVLGGYVGDPNIFRKASEIPLRGLVLTSMSSALIPLVENLDLPVLILEGFGKIPMNVLSYNLLTTHQNREVMINAEPFNRFTGVRPEVIIPLPTSRGTSPPLVIEDFSVGKKVRVVRAPYMAKTGTIGTLFSELIEFPSGVRTHAAQVNLENGESVKIPLVNLEVVG
jgi:hypothetical protein